MAVTVARCFAFVGPYLPVNSGFAVGNFIRDALNRQGRSSCKGDGAPRRTFHVRGGHGVGGCGRSRLPVIRARPYNVGSDEIVTIAELARQVASLRRAKGPLVRILGDCRAGWRRGTSYVPTSTRARSELGLDGDGRPSGSC